MLNVASLLKLPGIRRYAKGAVIGAGSAAAEMFHLINGSAATYKNPRPEPENQLAFYNAGDFFSESALFLGKPPVGFTIAMTDVIVLVIGRENAMTVFSGQPDLSYSVMEGLCKKLDAANAAYEKLLSEEKDKPSEQQQSESSPLFPEGHGSYLLQLDNHHECLYEQKTTCPLCGFTFTNLIVIQSKLRRESNDGDRIRYKGGIEPMHYELATCPNCLYSASSEAFGSVGKQAKQRIFQELEPYKGMPIKSGFDRDTFTIFAGYYLTLRCAPICLDDYQITTGGLWQKLNKMYQDCDDEAMSAYASAQALKDYKYAYENLYISERQTQQLCYVMGDIYYKQGDLDEARNFFHMVKTNRDGTAVLRRQADLRLDQIREIRKGN